MNTIEISDAEWDVMRIIWTLGPSTSKEIADVLIEKKGWKAATVKTLLGRLVKKGALDTKADQHAFIYSSTVAEQTMMDQSLTQLFEHLCAMRIGQSLENSLPKLALSKKDIESLQAILAQKALTAPDEVPCNCVDNNHTYH